MPSCSLARRARRCRRRGRSRRSPRRTVDVLDARARVVRLRVAAARLLQPVEAEPELGRRLLDRVEQVVDRLVARRGDADALAARDQVGDQPPRRPRLPRAGRPLDHEVAAVEREHERLHLLEVGRLHRRGRTARGAGPTRAPGSGGRRRAASGRAARARPPGRRCRTGRPGISASGSGTSVERAARA